MTRISAKRGQTILELTFVTLSLMIFFGLTYYLAAIFSVAQQQTMLNRTQAFIELGNFSYYGAAEHGKDDPKDKRSRVVFFMGEKSGATRVDFDKQEEFKKAVEGELELDIYSTERDEEFWEKFAFPKSITKVQWLQEGGTPLFEVTLGSVMAIVHNRSVDFNKTATESDYDSTGMFSGGLHFNQYAELSNQAPQKGVGMVDNVDAVKAQLRELVKNDPSLSDEAKELERNLSVSESITGGAAAALISMAIQAVAQLGMAAIEDAMAPALAEGAGAGAGGASNVEQFFNGLTHGMTDPFAGASGFASGNLFAGPLNAITAPVRNVANGFGNIASGASSIGTSGYSGLFTTMKGLSQVGQTVQLGMGLAGQNVQGLNIAVSALALPSAISNGFQQIDSALNNPNLVTGGVDMVGVIKALPSLTQPITNLVVAIAPEAAVPMGYINTVVGVANVAVNLPTQLGDLASGTLTAVQTVKTVGELTAGIGQLYSGVATIAGEDPSIGSYLMMAGGAMQLAGDTAQFVIDLDAKGVDVRNPLNVIGEMAKANIENVKSAFNQLGEDLTQAGADIQAGLNDLFGPKETITAADGFGNSVDQLVDNTTGVFSDDRVGKAITNTNLLKMDNTLSKLESRMNLQFEMYGQEGEIADNSERFGEIRDAIASLRQIKAGAPQTAERTASIEAGARAAQALNAKMEGLFGEKLNGHEIAQKQIRGMMYNNEQLSLGMNLIMNNQKYSDALKIEQEYQKKNPTSHAIDSLTGGRLSDRVYREQIEAVQDLYLKSKQGPKDRPETENQAKEQRYQVAMELLTAAETVSTNGPISTDNEGLLKEGASRAAAHLKKVSAENQFTENMKVRMNNAIRKLEDLSNGSRDMDFRTPRETLEQMKKDLAEREAAYQRRMSILQSLTKEMKPRSKDRRTRDSWASNQAEFGL